jgi:VWFA-related protein
MRIALVLIELFALLAALAAQQPPVQEQPAQFTANSNLVIVDVVVRDKSGKPMEGLKQSDFTLLEDGKPQKLSVFEFQKLSHEPQPSPKLTLADELKLPEAPKTTITAEQPGQSQYRDKRLMVFFLDFSSMGMNEQLRAQEAALDYVNKHITKDDMVAIMLYASTVQVLTDFTNNRDVLTNILKSLPIGEMSELAGLADTGDDNGQDTGAAFVADETEFNIFNTDQKLAAIEQASRMLSTLPEKKALIYFSAGVSKTGIDNQAQLEASVNAAAKANLAIYAVDARGLMADPPGAAASKAGPRGTTLYNGGFYNSQRATINDSQETLYTLAADTGGKAFFNSNDLADEIVQAQEQMRSYYLLGYYSTNPAKDGRYRKITVKLNNKLLSAKLEHRPGYYADKVWGKLNGQEKEQQLKEVLSAGNPVTDLPLALQIDYFRISASSYYVPVSIKIPGSVVALAAKGGAAVTQFDFAGQIQDEQHAVAGNVRDNIKIRLDQGNAAKGRKSFQYDAGFTLEPGKYQMKFVVRENITGKMGTFETHFTIPDLSADTPGLKLSSVIWSNQREPLQAAVGAAEKASHKEVSANPLIADNQKIVPNITHVFRRDQNLYITFDVYDSIPDPAKGRSVKVSMSVFTSKGVKAFEIGPIAATQLVSSRPEAVPVQVQIPLKNMTPGRYVCQINIVDEFGRKFAFRRAPLIVL